MKLLLIVLIIITAILLVLMLVRLFVQQIILKKSHSANEVNEIITAQFGRHVQKILLEGKNDSLPILITLHGGPEVPIFNGFGYRGFYKEFTEHYIVVHWDQYGCGANFAKSINLAKVSDFTAMVCDLVDYLKRKYPGKPVYLYGISWGTILTMEASGLLEKEIAGIINYGPVTSLRDAKKNEYEALIKTHLSAKKRKRLEELMQKDTLPDYLPVEAMSNATVCMMNRKDGNRNSKSVACLFRIIISPDYSMRDVWHAFYWLFHLKAMFPLYRDLYETNEKEAMEKVEVPLLILQGETDPFGDHKFLEKLPEKNQYVRYISLSKSGHMPNNNGFETLLKETVAFSKGNKEGL